jgi:hypothetical protein
MKHILVVVMALCCFSATAQQSLHIKLKIKAGEPPGVLPDATIILMQGNKSAVKAISNKSGLCSFSNLHRDSCVLIANFIGFKSDTQKFYLKIDTSISITLKASNFDLKEVKIKSDVTPVMLRNDTLVFNTKAYPTRPYATVDELLKMLPGVEVDKDGNVSYNGQKVDKIFIDGKPFFIDDLRKATTSLTADMIKSIELYDSRSEEEKQAGIVSMSQTKTLDLKLKDDKKDGFTGKIYAGAGNNDSYAAGGTLTKLGDKSNLSVQANINDISDQFTGQENNRGGQSLGKQTTGVLGFEYSDQVSKKLLIYADGNFKASQTNQQSNSYRQTFLGDSSLVSSNKSSNENRSDSYSTIINLQYKPDDRDYLSYTFSAAPAKNTATNLDSTLLTVQKAGTQYLSSKGFAGNSSVKNSNSFSNELNFVHRFQKEGRSLTFKASNNINSGTSTGYVDNLVQTFNPINDQIANQQQLSPSQDKGYAAGLLYQEPLDKRLTLKLSYDFNYDQRLLQQQSFDFDGLTGKYDSPDTLNSDRFNTVSYTHDFKEILSNALGAKLHYEVTMEEQSFNLENNNLSGVKQPGQKYFNVLPQVNLKYTLSKTEKIDLFYSSFSLAPSINQLQPLPDLTNPYLIKLGNPDLKQAFKQVAFVTFVSSENNSLFNLTLLGDVNKQQIGQSVNTLAGGVQQIQYVNLNGVYHVSLAPAYSFPVIKQSIASATIGATFTYGHDRSLVDELDNINQNQSINSHAGLNIHPGKSIFIYLFSTLTYRVNQYSLPNQPGAKSWQRYYYVNFTYVLPFSISVGAIYNYLYQQSGSLPTQQTNFLDAFISRSIFGNGAGQLRLSGFNLLDTKSSISQVNGPNFTEVDETNSQSRFLLLSLVYNFNKFKKSK